jgi:hypothetical protein
VDLVDEEHVARLERREDRRDVALALERGPATWRMPTPSSLRTICASDVLPSPGGPASRTWSSASPRAFAASSAIDELLLDALLADEVVERRAGGATARAPPRRRPSTGARNCVTPLLPQTWRTCSSTGRSGSTSASARSASIEGPAELDERVAGGEVADRRPAAV